MGMEQEVKLIGRGQRQPFSSPGEVRGMDVGGGSGGLDNQHSGKMVGKAYPTFWMRCPCQL